MKTNEELQKDVMDEIRWDPMLRHQASAIGVSVRDGVVRLTGKVDTYSRKLAAEKVAQRVKGVKVIAVDLDVNLERSATRNDVAIAEAIRDALRWHSLVNEDLIEITVDNGWVFLDGNAEWDYQKKAAEVAVQNLTGVRGITNRIKVNSGADDVSELRKRIASAFHRSAAIDSSNIQVEIKDGNATLRGTVRSWAEKKEAENVVWSAKGIIAVDNRIEIDTDLVEA